MSEDLNVTESPEENLSVVPTTAELNTTTAPTVEETLVESNSSVTP